MPSAYIIHLILPVSSLKSILLKTLFSIHQVIIVFTSVLFVVELLNVPTTYVLTSYCTHETRFFTEIMKFIHLYKNIRTFVRS